MIAIAPYPLAQGNGVPKTNGPVYCSSPNHGIQTSQNLVTMQSAQTSDEDSAVSHSIAKIIGRATKIVKSIGDQLNWIGPTIIASFAFIIPWRLSTGKHQTALTEPATNSRSSHHKKRFFFI